MKLSYFLPAPGFRVKPGMTIAKATAWQKKNASLFMSFTIIAMDTVNQTKRGSIKENSLSAKKIKREKWVKNLILPP
jgi:hypothetical protein